MKRRRETLRKAIHAAFGLFAFIVPWFETWQVASFLGAALLFNFALMPRWGGRELWRERDHAQGTAIGMIAYPLVLLLLFLLFPERPEIASGAWALLAFGDGAASVAGVWLGGRRLSWNPGKSVAGFLAHWLLGGVALTLLLHLFKIPSALLLAFAASLWSAWLESQPQKLDDNIVVPPLNALLLWCLLESVRFPAFTPLAVGAAVNLGFGLLAYRLGAVSISGIVAGTMLGSLIWTGLGLPGFFLMFAFIAVGSAATRLGFRKKEEAGVAEARGGRRGASNALANLTVAALAALFASTTPHADLFTLAACAALAAATADTLGSEIGQAFGGRPIYVTTLRPAPIGADGGVTLLGTAATLLGAAMLAMLGFAFGLYDLRGCGIVLCGGFVGAWVDSLLGATLERRGRLDNQGVNFLCTLAGALTAVVAV